VKDRNGPIVFPWVEVVGPWVLLEEFSRPSLDPVVRNEQVLVDSHHGDGADVELLEVEVLWLPLILIHFTRPLLHHHEVLLNQLSLIGSPALNCHGVFHEVAFQLAD